MSNFKSGSGNLDFGGTDNDDENDETDTGTSEAQTENETETDTNSTSQTTAVSPDSVSPDTERSFDQPASDRVATGESTPSGSPANEYPYFVRRSNVGDERDTRLEIHVRDKVADQEANFRTALAEQLGANEVSKTDAREFALLAAFHHPERVAELMQDEGFGKLG